MEKERGVMPEDEEVKAEGGEVEKERFQCSDCEKTYSFLHKLQHHQTWSCKKKVPARLSGVQDGLEINKGRSYFHVSCALFNTWDPLR